MKKNITKLFILFSFIPMMFLSSCQMLGIINDDGEVDVLKVVDLTLTGIESTTNIVEAAQGLTPEAQYTIGRSAAAIILQQYDIYDNPELTEYVNMICKVLTMHSPLPYLYKDYCVAILDSPEINAISTPGGHILISKGLIESTTSEDAIAAVLAHEISHIQLGHSTKAINATRTGTALVGGIQDLSTALFDDTDLESLGEKVNVLAGISNNFSDFIINTGYSQSQEFDADKNALLLMTNAGYNPYAMLDMLHAIDNGEKMGWGKTHPSPKNRIERSEKDLNKGEYPHIDMEKRMGRFEYQHDMIY